MTGRSGTRAGWWTPWLVGAAILLAPTAPANSSGDDAGALPIDSSDRPPDHGFEVDRIAGPFRLPWSVAFLPNGDMLVTERPGTLQLVRLPDGKEQSIYGVPPVLRGGHGGLLEVMTDLDFASNRLVYLSYLFGTEDAATIRVFRGKLVGRHLVEGKVIFESGPPAPGMEQLGGRLAMDSNRRIYLTLGDRFDLKRAQALDDDSGTIVRFDRDGTPPADNPFVATPGARPEIFSYGHRNPQGLAIEPSTGAVWAHEHGPKGGDEVNAICGGCNYGWPVVTYGVGYDDAPIGIGTDAPGMRQPIHYWVPSIAPSGMAFYRDDRIEAFKGKLLVGALAGQMISGLDLRDGRNEEERFFVQEYGRIRDVRQGPDGDVYFLTDDAQGYLYRIRTGVEQAGKLPPQQAR